MSTIQETLSADKPGLIRDLRQSQARWRLLVLFVLAIATIGASIASLTIGSVAIPFQDVLSALLFPSNAATTNSQAVAIVEAIRLPRLILALCVGATLGVCGAALQGLFRNPLADPGIIGVSSGGALAVALLIVLGHSNAPETLAWAGPYALPIVAFAGSISAIVCVYALSWKGGATQGASLILAGIAINALVGSALGYLSFASTDEQLRQFTFWTLGSLARSNWATLWPAAIAMAFTTLAVLQLAIPLNLYLLGEREAAHVGVNVEALKIKIIVLTALGVGTAVALTGIIGFVGLAAPHIVRLLAGSDHRIVLPASALFGGLLLVAADMIARTAVTPAELPVGIVTGAIGGPFFLWVLGRYRYASLG